MCVDPATGIHSATDDSAITVCGYHRDEDLVFILEAWSMRILPSGLIEEMFELYSKWKPDRIGIEEQGFQSVLRHFLEQEQLRKGVFFRSEPIKSNVSKGRRIIERLQPFHSSRSIHYLNGDFYTDKLRDEQRKFRLVKGEFVGKSPNLLDSLAMHVPFWQTMPKDGETADDIPLEHDEERPDLKPVYNLRVRTA